MMMTSLSDKEIVREYENSEDDVIAELCKRLSDNLSPETCELCDQWEEEAREHEEELSEELEEKERACAIIEKLEDALRELDPENELLSEE